MYGVEFLGEFDVYLQWRKQRAKVLVKPGEVPVYFIENDYYFSRGALYGFDDDNERFAFFGKAVLDMLAMLDFYPDVIHCNDWQTGPVCMYLKEMYNKVTEYSKIKTLFTIHNLQYQGRFSLDTMELLGVSDWAYANIEFYNTVCYMKMGLVYADYISTVSGTYAQEIQTPEYGYGMDGILRSRSDRLCGILNGIDFTANNPETDGFIVKHFSAAHPEGKAENKHALQKRLGLEEREVPLIAMITRLADQKGVDILAPVLDEMMRRDVQFVLLGTGEPSYEYTFRSLQSRYPGRVSANIFFDEALAQQIYASADLFLMPSKFEPCGLGQMFSLRFGTVPIARKTGGLADTIRQYNPETKRHEVMYAGRFGPEATGQSFTSEELSNLYGGLAKDPKRFSQLAFQYSLATMRQNEDYLKDPSKWLYDNDGKTVFVPRKMMTANGFRSGYIVTDTANKTSKFMTNEELQQAGVFPKDLQTMKGLFDMEKGRADMANDKVRLGYEGQRVSQDGCVGVY